MVQEWAWLRTLSHFSASRTGAIRSIALQIAFTTGVVMIIWLYDEMMCIVVADYGRVASRREAVNLEGQIEREQRATAYSRAG